MASRKASQQGLEKIRDARKTGEKEWKWYGDDRPLFEASKILEPNKTWGETGIYAYGVSQPTWKKFLLGKPIRSKTFNAFCQALELNPDEIAENLEPASLGTSELPIIELACRMIDSEGFLPIARKRLQKIIDTSQRQISVERNKLIQTPLPEHFKVYVKGESLISHYEPGYEEKVLPTFNVYKGKDGGYIECYIRDPEKKSVCSVGGGFYLIGQIRLQGKYNGRIFVPKGCEGKDLNTVRWITNLCKQHFSSEDNIWVGNDTGGWFDPDSLIA